MMRPFRWEQLVDEQIAESGLVPLRWPATNIREEEGPLPRSRGPRCTFYLNTGDFLIGLIALVTVPP